MERCNKVINFFKRRRVTVVFFIKKIVFFMIIIVAVDMQSANKGKSFESVNQKKNDKKTYYQIVNFYKQNAYGNNCFMRYFRNEPLHKNEKAFIKEIFRQNNFPVNSKVIVQFISKNPDASYEDFVKESLFNRNNCVFQEAILGQHSDQTGVSGRQNFFRSIHSIIDENRQDMIAYYQKPYNFIKILNDEKTSPMSKDFFLKVCCSKTKKAIDPDKKQFFELLCQKKGFNLNDAIEVAKYCFLSSEKCSLENFVDHYVKMGLHNSFQEFLNNHLSDDQVRSDFIQHVKRIDFISEKYDMNAEGGKQLAALFFSLYNDYRSLYEEKDKNLQKFFKDYFCDQLSSKKPKKHSFKKPKKHSLVKIIAYQLLCGKEHTYEQQCWEFFFRNKCVENTRSENLELRNDMKKKLIEFDLFRKAEGKLNSLHLAQLWLWKNWEIDCYNPVTQKIVEACFHKEDGVSRYTSFLMFMFDSVIKKIELEYSKKERKYDFLVNRWKTEYCRLFKKANNEPELFNDTMCFLGQCLWNNVYGDKDYSSTLANFFVNYSDGLTNSSSSMELADVILNYIKPIEIFNIKKDKKEHTAFLKEKGLAIDIGDSKEKHAMTTLLDLQISPYCHHSILMLLDLPKTTSNKHFMLEDPLRFCAYFPLHKGVCSYCSNIDLNGDSYICD
jgi:hypothetical protein